MSTDAVLERLSGSLRRDVWTLQDRLRYSPHVEAFTRFVRIHHNLAPLVASVQGPWGQGKTSFMRMVQYRLDPAHPDFDPQKQPFVRRLKAWWRNSWLRRLVTRRRKEKLKHPTVWFNAWHHQNSAELWAGLAYSIISQLSMRLGSGQREWFWLSLQWNRMDRNRLRSGLVSLIIEHALPITFMILAAFGLVILNADKRLISTVVAVVALMATVPVLLALRTAVAEMMKGLYAHFVRDPDYRGRMGVLALTQEDVLFALRRLVDDKHPAVVFIDDLDRCFPAHVAEVIGAINLFLANNHRSSIFVLGMDTEVVAASLEVVHEKVVGKVSRRDGELGWNYIDKFVQLPVALPRVQVDDQLRYFEALLAGPESVAVGPEPPAEEQVEPDLRMELGELSEYVRKNLQGHLSLNPRTLVKIANVHRFQLLLQEARKHAGLERADERQILAWSIVFARWPHFVRWLQRLPPLSTNGAGKESVTLERLIERAQMTSSAEAWATELDTDGVDHGGWALAPGLWELLREENSVQDLAKAPEHGFW